MSMPRAEWIRKMRKLYREITEQYLQKEYSEYKAKMIARKVVFKLSKKHHRRVTRKELEE